MNSNRVSHLLVGLSTCVIMLLLVWPTADLSLGGDHYVHLARSLANGKLNVDQMSSQYRDYVAWQGHKYLPFGPVPALLLVPFVSLLEAGVSLVFFGYAFTLVNVALWIGILKRLGIADERRPWILLLFFGGTVYLSVALGGISTFFAHIVFTTFLLLALREALGTGRALLIGLFIGLAAGARFTALFTLPFFLVMLWATRPASAVPETRSRKFGRALSALGGVTLPVMALAAYNFYRFGDPAETGFGIALLYSPVLEEARSIGLFSIHHVPKNLMMMLVQGPQLAGGADTPILKFPFVEPSPWGMGIFFTSPWLLYVFRAPLGDRLVQACWIAIAVTLIPILTYYGIGVVQFGYRYALDFMPFLALLAVRGMPHPLTRTAVVIATASVIINVWGAIMLSIWI